MLALAGLTMNEAYGWGVGALLDFIAPYASWKYISSVRWGGVIGIAAALLGCTLLFWPAKSPPAPPAPPDPTRQLIDTAQRFLNDLRECMSISRVMGSASVEDRLIDVMQQGCAVALSFEKAGYRVPELPDEARECATFLGQYFRTLLPIMREGHIVEAKEVAEDLTKRVAEQSDG